MLIVRFEKEREVFKSEVPDTKRVKQLSKYLDLLNEILILNPQDLPDTVGSIVRSYVENIYAKRLHIILLICPVVCLEKDVKQIYKIRSNKPFPNWDDYCLLPVSSWSEKAGKRGRPYLALQVPNNIVYLFNKFGYFMRDENSMPKRITK
jgi:hypothetical protein